MPRRHSRATGPGRRPAPRARRLAALAAAALLAGACAPDQQFPQRPEFKAIRESLGSDPPSAADRRLLERHRPEFHLPPGHEGAIDFYRDYIAHGELRDSDGRLVSTAVTQDLLNRHKSDPGVVFTHKPPTEGAEPPRPLVLGSVTRSEIPFLGGKYTFLAYHAVFRMSGLPLEIGPVRELLARALGDRRDWHQLDHYTAVFIVLDPSMEPRAVVLQQHNAMRTHLVDDRGPFPRGEPVRVDVAVDSNELYPHSPQRRRHRAVGFLNADTVDFMAGLTDRVPMRGSHDVTHGARRMEYELGYLAPDDAFYVFEGYLGERRRLPGRKGPPGAIYNTWPTLKPPEVMLPAFFWNEPDEEYARLLKTGDGLPDDDALAQLQERFADALRESRRNGGD